MHLSTTPGVGIIISILQMRHLRLREVREGIFGAAGPSLTWVGVGGRASFLPAGRELIEALSPPHLGCAGGLRTERSRTKSGLSREVVGIAGLGLQSGRQGPRARGLAAGVSSRISLQ